MTLTITVYFSHIEEGLRAKIEKHTGFAPKLAVLGKNDNNRFPVYACEFDCTKKDDQKILQSLKKMNLTISEIIDSPPAITTDANLLRH